MKRLVPLIAALMIPAQALAWGSVGHRIMGRGAAEPLPADLPACLKAPEAVEMLGELDREPDRSRSAGQPHDADEDPGHFLDLDDAGKVLNGPAVTAMPVNRDAYEAAMRTAG